MKLLRISITLIVLLLSCVLTNSQEVVFTPSQYYFSLQEDTNSTLGPVYITSNTDITPSYSSSSSNFVVASSGIITLKAGVSLDYEDSNQLRLTTVSENTTTNTANVIICLTDVNDNSPTSPTPTDLSISITTGNLTANSVIVRFYSSDADYNENGLVMFTTDSNIFSLTIGGVLVNTDDLVPGNYTAVIMAVDDGSPSLTSTSVFNLTIVADQSLSLQQNRYAFLVDENAANNTLIGTITPFGTTVALITADPSIAFNSSNGEISVRSGLDYETMDEFTFDLVNASATNTILGTLVIYVINSEDVPPTLAQTTYNIDLPIDTPANYAVWCIPQLNDGEEDAELTYSLTDANNLFEVDTDGIITITSSIIDLTSGTVLTVNLTLTDRTQSSDVTLNFSLIASNPPLPGIPQSLNANNDNFTWTAPAGIYPTEVFPAGLLYQVTYRTLQNLSDIQTQTTNETILQTTLSPNDVYIYTVAASILNSNFGQTAVTTFATGTENITATTVNSTAITVSFRQLQYCGTDVTIQYDVAYDGVELDTNTRNVSITITNQTASGRSCGPQSVNLTGLEENVNYMISLSVTITELGVDSILIAEVMDETFEAAPGIGPANVTLQTINSQTIQVTICPPSRMQQNGLITSYNVSYTGNPFDTTTRFREFNATLSFPAAMCSVFNLTGLQEYNNYTINARAVNSAGSSELSTEQTAQTNEAVSAAPRNISSENITSTSFCVTFDPPTNITQNGPITNYTVTYVGDLFDIPEDSTTVSVSSVVYPLTESSRVCISDLEEYDNYTVLIRAVNGAGEGTAANITVETLEAAPAAAVQDVSEMEITSVSINVCFDPPTDSDQNGIITSFNVTYFGSPFQTNSVTVTMRVIPTDYPLDRTVCRNLTSLQQNNNYNITVIAINSAGPGPISQSIIVTTSESAPGIGPANVTLQTINSQTIQVTICPPSRMQQNGLIISYNVSYTGNPFDTTTRFREFNATLSFPAARCSVFNLTGFQEYNNYTINARAVNSAGSSELSTEQTAQTNEAVSDAPRNLSSENITSTSFCVTFDPPTNITQNGPITNYTVTYVGDLFDTTEDNTTVSVSSVVYPLTESSSVCISDLEEYDNYTVLIRAVNGAGEGTAANITVETLEAAPTAAVQDVSEMEITSVSINVCFDPPTDSDQNGIITSFNVTYFGSPFQTNSVTVTAPVVPTDYPLDRTICMNLTGLQQNNNYNITVIAINSAGPGPISQSIIVTTSESAPGIGPANVTLQTINSQTIQVTICPPAQMQQNGLITSYNVSYTGNPFDTTTRFREFNATLSFPAAMCNVFNLTGLQEYNNYTINARAVNSAGSSDLSTEQTAQTNEAAPSAPPQNFAAMSGRNISLTYMPPPPINQNGVLLNYTIEYFGVERDTSMRRRIVLASLLSINITGLDEDTTYTFRIRASTSVGFGPFSDPINATTQAAPPSSPPVNITITVINATAFNSTWRIPDEDEHNGVLNSVDISLVGIDVETSIIINVPISTDDTSLQTTILTPLEEYVNYSVRFAVANGRGFSPLSVPIFRRTDPTAPSDTPQNVTTEALSPTSISVTFYPPPEIDQNGPITSYNISYTGEIFDTTTQFETINITSRIYPAVGQVSFDLTGLQEYNNYTINVSAINGIGSSEFTAGVIQITNEAAPSNTSQNVTTVAVNSTSIRVTFNPPLEIDQNGPITSYNISYTGEIFDTDTRFVNVPITNPIYPADAQVSFDLTGLQEYNNYTISVSAINRIGSSEFTAGVIQITNEAAPNATPQNVATVAVSPTSIRVTFYPPPEIDQNGLITSYNISYTGEIFDTTTQFETINIAGRIYPAVVQESIDLTGLQENNNYTISVSAINGIRSSEFTAGVIQLTNEAAPSNTSQNVVTEAVSPTSIRVTFNPPPEIDQNGPITSYNISYTGDIFDIVNQFVNVPITNPIYPADAQVSFDLIGLQEYNNYTISVSAINGIGSSEFTAGVIQITDEAAPNATPLNVATVAVNSTSIRVTFNPPPRIHQNGPITPYNISYTGEIFDTDTRFVNVPITPLIYPADAQVSFDLTGLQEYNNYTIRVSAVNRIGSSEFTAGVIQITNEAAPSNTPQNVVTEALGPTSIRVTFSPPLDIDQNGPITSYNISYTGEIFDNTTQFETINIAGRIYPAIAQESFDLTGLQEYNNYTISVSAINGIGSSEFTAGVIQLTNEGVSGAPTIIDATSNDPRQVCVIFTPALPIDQNGDITSYFVNLTSLQISGPNDRQCLVTNTSCFSRVDNDIRICFNNLDEGILYNVSVRAIIGANQGDASGVINVMTMGVSPPTLTPFATPFTPTPLTTSTTITLTIPFISTEFLNSDPDSYIVEFQGFLFLDSLFPSSRRRRQSNSNIVAMTELMTLVVAYTDNREIFLTGLLPNYRYEVNVAIRTANGQTLFVLIVPPTLATSAPSGPPINVAASPVTAPDGTPQMSLNVAFANDFFTVNGPPDSFTIFYETGGEVEQHTVYIPPTGDPGPYEITINNLPPNRLYTITVNVSTPDGTSGRSSGVSATTYPLTPTVPPVIPTTAPTTPPDTYTVDIVVPTQNAFITANIAVVYIITDYGEDDFSRFVDTRKFTVISSDTMNGFINGLDGDPRIRIQAALNSTYFDQSGNTFTFLIGNNEETTYLGKTYVNYRLEPESRVLYTYYILFFNEEGVTSASFTITGTPDQISTPALPGDPTVIVIILLLIIVILAVVIIVLIILVVWYMRRRKNTSVPSERASVLKRNNSQSKDSKDKSQENLNSHVLPPPVIMKSTITIANFAKYVEGMAANDRLRFHEEYMSIKDPPHTHDMCSMSSNGPRNRYRDIRTYDHSRVALTIIDGDEYSDYINANFIHGYYKKNEYIAAQGPLDNTIADFWRVVWDWNVPTVVMLTKCVERGRRKCSQYWPDKGTAAYSFYDSTGSSREFVEVTIERETVYAHYIIREIMFTRVDHPNQMKRLIQWHYTSWPDMGVPENGTSLLKFVQKVHQAHPADSGPMIVHCSAGVGRTGTFITLGCMMPMIREQSLVDVYNFVNRMRDSRNRMVQVEAQYVFIHEALLEFIQHGDTEVAGEDLDTYFRSLDTEEENGTSKLLGQFKRLAYPVRPTEYSIAQSAQNKAKNRYVNILPYNNKRVKLTPVPGVENSDYINASYIDGYWIKNAFIATQGPLQGTIEDFWKMIWEQHVNTIVMLTSEVEAGRERCAHYWPDEQPEYYGQVMVELVDTRMDEGNEYIVHELKVTQTKENRVRKLNHFQYTGWHEREMPDSPTGLNNMIGEIDKFVRGTNPTHPIVIHCSAGVGRTGVFVGAFNMMESLRHDNTVDVFNTVRMMRYQRPAMVQTATQYRFCYIALMDFVSNSEADSVYQNVPKM